MTVSKPDFFVYTQGFPETDTWKGRCWVGGNTDFGFGER